LKELYKEAEEQLCEVCDKVLEDGSPDPKFIGRAGGLKVVRQQLVPKTAGQFGIADSITMGLVWLRRALKDLAILVNVKSRGLSFSKQRLQQWKSIIQGCEKLSWCSKKLLNAEE